MRAGPHPRIVDAALLAGLAVGLLTGVWSLIVSPGDWWVLAGHGVAGLCLVVLLGWKLRRELPRLRRADWSAGLALSVVLTGLAVAVLATGIGWTTGLLADVRLAGWTVLVLHGLLGVGLTLLLGAHLVGRLRTPASADWEGRRTTLQFLGLVAGGAIAWRLTQAVGSLVGAPDRFTGSREAGGTGTDFPVTSWVLDDPAPVDGEAWQLDVVGAVDQPVSLGTADLPAPDEAAETSAVLDCTSGWYADRRWQGIALADLLATAAPVDEAAWVTIHSVTGYRFGVPLDQAEDLLLATHVDGERLTHGHGYPLRVVAPGRRGFQWVKWVSAVEVRTAEDWGRWVAIFTSWVQ